MALYIILSYYILSSFFFFFGGGGDTSNNSLDGVHWVSNYIPTNYFIGQ